MSEQRKKTRATVNGAKRNQWHETATDLSAHAPDGKIWTILRSLENKSPRYTQKAPVAGENWSSKKKATWFPKQCIEEGKIDTQNARCRNQYRKVMDEQKRIQRPLTTPPITMEELEALLQGMDPKKACGPDHVEIEFLREISQLGKRRILNLFNRSYRSGYTPASWRSAEIISIPKPGKPGEFRPISLTNAIARIMKKLMLKSLTQWLEPRLPQEQAAFRRHRSCEE